MSEQELHEEKKNPFLEQIIDLFNRVYEKIDPSVPEYNYIRKLKQEELRDIVTSFRTYGPSTEIITILRRKNELIQTIIEKMALKKSAEGEIRFAYLDIKDEIIQKAKADELEKKKKRLEEKKLKSTVIEKNPRKKIPNSVDLPLFNFYKDMINIVSLLKDGKGDEAKKKLIDIAKSRNKSTEDIKNILNKMNSIYDNVFISDNASLEQVYSSDTATLLICMIILFYYYKHGYTEKLHKEIYSLNSNEYLWLYSIYLMSLLYKPGISEPAQIKMNNKLITLVKDIQTDLLNNRIPKISKKVFKAFIDIAINIDKTYFTSSQIKRWEELSTY